jgi:hypothetical protein
MMRIANRILGTLAATVLGAGIQLPMIAKAEAGTQPALPDWSGVWNPAETNIFDATAPKDPRNKNLSSSADMREFPPYNAEWEARYKKLLVDNAAGKPTDPTAGCVPGGMPRIMTTPYPFEIIIQANRVIILHEAASQVRRIWTDGRSHPVDPDLSYMGHSIGHWEGDTLVVDTMGMRGDTVFDVTAAPHSDKIHVTERIRRISPTKLEDRFVVEDPVAFTKPWLVVRTYTLKPDWEIREYVCEENNRNPINPDGSTAFIAPK